MSNQPDNNQLRCENASLQLSNTQLPQHQEQMVVKLLAQAQLIAELQTTVAELRTQLEQRPPSQLPPPSCPLSSSLSASLSPSGLSPRLVQPNRIRAGAGKSQAAPLS